MNHLSSLPSMPPDAGASIRIRERCHQALSRQRRHEHRGDPWWFAAAAAYLLTAIQQALAFLR
jgi:hypothetical protein